MTLQPPPSPPTQTQCQQYLCCYSPNVDQSFKVGELEYLEQITNVMVTFVQATFVLLTFEYESQGLAPR